MKRVEQARRYLNLLHEKDMREYGWAYLNWLRNGAVGIEPEARPRVRMGKVRDNLHVILGSAPIEAAQE